MWPLLAGGALFAGGMALVWLASRRRTVKVAVQELPGRGGRKPVRVRLRYEPLAERGTGDPRDVLGRLARAAAAEDARAWEALVAEAREAAGIHVLGFEIEQT